MIEKYFKILKSGCKVESCCLGDATRLTNFFVIKNIIAVKIFSISKLMLTNKIVSCDTVLSSLDWKILYKRFNSGKSAKKIPSVYQTGVWIACLCGYMKRKNDPPPGARYYGEA